MNRSKVNSLP